MEFVKNILREIIQAPDDAYNISAKNAIDMGLDMDPRFPASRTEALCDRLVKQGWLRRSP